MNMISFQVAEYDAPLDLILHLLSKHKLNITDIDISSLLEQYIDIIETWQVQNLDFASDFLEMASRLVHMKTVSLLPRHEEESERLRRDFSGELMEYHTCKLAAELLNDTNYYSHLFVREPLEIDFDHVYKHQHPPHILYNALIDAVGRGDRRKPPPRDSFDPLVTRPLISVSTKIFSVLRILREKTEVTLEELFNPDLGRSGLVATFLAVLELMKSGGIILEGDRLSIRTSS